MLPLHLIARAEAGPKCFSQLATFTSPRLLAHSSSSHHLKAATEHTPVSTIPPQLSLYGTHPNTPDLCPLQIQPSHQGSLGMEHLRTCCLLLHPSHQDATAHKASAHTRPHSSHPTRESPVQSAPKHWPEPDEAPASLSKLPDTCHQHRGFSYTRLLL